MNQNANIEITPNKMLAVISFKEGPFKEGPLSIVELRDYIESKGIIYGIDEEVLLGLSLSRVPNFKYVIAKGTEPTKGQDATNQFYFDEKNLNEIKITEKNDGTVDFKDLNIVHNVKKGQVLYEKIPAQRGQAGRNIFGQEIAAPMGEDIRLPKGKNVDILEDGYTLVAQIDGKLCYDGYNIYITPLLMIQEDVDSSTGNIEFVGSVVINGNVKNGFSVKAKGNIEIHGSIEAAYIESDGDVLVWCGFQGMDKGYIKAKGNVVIKFIQNGKVEAGGNVMADAIMHSYVAANNIHVDKGKGLIVGGELLANHLISAYTIGSSMATHTDLHIGLPVHIMNEYKEVEKVYFTAQGELEKINKGINFLLSKQGQGQQLTSDKIDLLRKLLDTKDEVESKYNEAFSSYTKLKAIVQEAVSGNIRVKRVLYPGVRITIGGMIKYIIEEYGHCSIKKDGGDIKIGLY